MDVVERWEEIANKIGILKDLIDRFDEEEKVPLTTDLQEGYLYRAQAFLDYLSGTSRPDENPFINGDFDFDINVNPEDLAGTLEEELDYDIGNLVNILGKTKRVNQILNQAALNFKTRYYAPPTGQGFLKLQDRAVNQYGFKK